MRHLYALLVALLLPIAGCGQAAPSAAGDAVRTARYVQPPFVTAVQRDAAGRLVIRGRAPPGERVRLIEMDGTAHGLTADADGVFTLVLPSAQPADRLISLSAQRTGQTVASDGWLYSPAAAPERSVMLRPGGPSLPVGPAPLLATIDVDSGGGVALAGAAGAGQELDVRINGISRGRPITNSEGVWSLVLNAQLDAGEQNIRVVGPDGQIDLRLSPSFVPPTTTLESARDDDAIRVAWALPGGGAQTTYVLLGSAR